MIPLKAIETAAILVRTVLATKGLVEMYGQEVLFHVHGRYVPWGPWYTTIRAIKELLDEVRSNTVALLVANELEWFLETTPKPNDRLFSLLTEKPCK